MEPKKKARTKSKARKSKFDQDKEQELSLGKIYFDDATLYSSLKFIQYVDMNTRSKTDPPPTVIQRDKDIQKQYSQYWVGYCLNKHLKQVITVLHPDFINKASCTDKDDNEVKIFDDVFINECMISKQNSSVPLTAEQKNLLNKKAFEAGNYPQQRV